MPGIGTILSVAGVSEAINIYKFGIEPSARAAQKARIGEPREPRSYAQCIRTFAEHTNVVVDVAISPDGRAALSGSYDNTLKLWDLTPYLPAAARS